MNEIVIDTGTPRNVFRACYSGAIASAVVNWTIGV